MIERGPFLFACILVAVGLTVSMAIERAGKEHAQAGVSPACSLPAGGNCSEWRQIWHFDSAKAQGRHCRDANEYWRDTFVRERTGNVR